MNVPYDVGFLAWKKIGRSILKIYGASTRLSGPSPCALTRGGQLSGEGQLPALAFVKRGVN